MAASPRGVVESSIANDLRSSARASDCIEPVPAALYRAGLYHKKAPRGSKLCVRFFLGELQAIGVIGAGPRPLFWQTFDLPSGEETAAILAAYSTLWMMGQTRANYHSHRYGHHPRAAGAGPGEAVGGVPSSAPARDWCDATGPRYDLQAAALGLALANPLADDTGVDLARTLKPPVSIGDVFPYGELVLHGVLLGAVSLFSIGAAAESNHRLKAVVGGLKAFSWLKNQDQPKLDAEKKAIQERLKAVGVFRDTRVKWSGSLRNNRRGHAGKHDHHVARGRRRDRSRIASPGLPRERRN